MTGRVATDVPAHLEDCWDEPDANLMRSDLEAFQGAWESVGGKRPAEFLVSGDHFTVRFADGDIYMGRLALQPDAWPPRLVFAIEEGPRHHRGLQALCIYELTGDVLRWCTAGPGAAEWPAAFAAEDDPKYLHRVFRRTPVAR